MAKTSDSLFELVNELQQLHGLRTDDYVRYRRYCGRKLERLRSKFNLHHTKKSQVKITIDLCKENPEVLHLILFKLEWFWAQINQLRNELSKNSRKKHHLRSICKNSMKYLEELEKLSQDLSIEISSNLRLEYLAYINLIEGIVKNELKEFSSSIYCLQKSKIIIEELIKRSQLADVEEGCGNNYDNGDNNKCDKNQLFGDNVLEIKLSDIETIIRVCQYSADMYESIIEYDVDSLNSFKMNLLTDNLSHSKITCDKNRLNSNKSQDFQFENDFQKEIRHKLVSLAKKGFSFKVNLRSLIEKLSKSKRRESDENHYSKSLDLLSNLLINLYKVQQKIGDISISASDSINAIDLIKRESEMIKYYKIGFLNSVLKHENKLKRHLNVFINMDKRKVDNENIMAIAPVPPKPSFYDISLDTLKYDEYVIESYSVDVVSRGFSNILSSFWKSKK